MLNQVQLIGNVGKDPEIRSTQGGSKVASFSLATSESWKDKQTGERREKTEWHKVVVWSEGLVKVVEQYVRKGSKLFVQGKLETRKWQDQNGQDRYTTEIKLTGFNAVLNMLNKVEGASRDERGDDERVPSAGPNYPSGGSLREDLDDEIPF